MNKEHFYTLKIQWTGNTGEGTSDYQSYERSHTISIDHKPDILASSDIPFRGDKTKPNPEDFLLSSIASCHMLWYLHLCADAGIVVTDYIDDPKAIMIQNESGGGHFKEVILYPQVCIKDASQINQANALHQKANEKCFIANSLNFKVQHKPLCKAIE